MEQPPNPNPNKEIRIRIEAPQQSSVPGRLPVVKPARKGVSKFFYVLLLSTFVCSGLSLYLSFFTH